MNQRYKQSKSTKFSVYSDASDARQRLTGRTRIRRRADGTFDLVEYDRVNKDVSEVLAFDSLAEKG